jgi:hypothetical protein
MSGTVGRMYGRRLRRRGQRGGSLGLLSPAVAITRYLARRRRKRGI